MTALPTGIVAGNSGHISHHNIIHALLNDVDAPFGIAPIESDVFASLPAAGQAGRLYFEKNFRLGLLVDDGANWRVADQSVVNAMDPKYGALGDGAATDTTAIQAALTAAAGNVCYLGPGTFLYDATFSVPANTTIRGAGMGKTIIKVKNSAATNIEGFTVVNASNVLFEDLTIDLNKAGNGDGGNAQAQMGVYVYASTPTGCSNVRFNRVEVKNGWHNGIYAVSSAVGTNTLDVKVTDCNLHDNDNNGLYGLGWTKGSVRGTDANDNGSSGLNIDGSTRFRVIANTCNGNGYQGITVSATQPCTRFVIGFNECDENGGAVGGGSPRWGIVVSIKSRRFTVIGNTCDGNVDGGITIDLADGSTTLWPADGNVVGNTCTNATGASSHGINVNYARDLVIVGNTCSDNAADADSAGIGLSGGWCLVEGNVLARNGYGLLVNYDGLSSPAMGSHDIGINKYISNVTGNLAGVPVTAIASSAFWGTSQVSRINGYRHSAASPGFAAGAALGSGPPAPSGGGNASDMAGNVGIGSGTSPTTGAAVVVTYAAPYPAATVPIPQLTAFNAATAALTPYISAYSNTGFTISFAVAPAASQALNTYIVGYHVIGLSP